MSTGEIMIKIVSILSNVMTILASGLAIFLYFSKRKQISSVFRLLLNYSYQLSLSELKEKLERLNEYRVDDQDQCEKIINIFNEIIGQIKGNDKLADSFSEILERIEDTISNKRKLTEPRKRALISELRERIRHIGVKNIDDLIGDGK